MNKLFIFFILFVSSFYLAFGINTKNNQPKTKCKTVKGLIIDEKDEPLAGASVIIKGTTIGAGTNSKGIFEININENQTPILRITCIGYKPLEYKLSKVENNINIKLEQAMYYEDEIVVTGFRIEKPLKDAPIITRMISENDIKKINPMEITTLLQYELPGIQFGRHHGSGLPTMSYQGTGGNYMLFLIDGERLSGEGAADNVDFSRFNIDEIERIEVVKGAMSTLYGSNALGGVVNIITKKANRPFVGNLSTSFNSIGEQKHFASVGTKQNRFSALSSLSYRQKNPFTISDNEDAFQIITLPDGTSDTNTFKKNTVSIKGYKLWDFNQKIKYVFSEKLSAQAKASYYNNRRLNANDISKFEDVYNDLLINIKANYLLSSDHFMSFSYNFDNFTKHYDFLFIDLYKEIYRNATNTIALNYVGMLNENNVLSAGMEMNQEDLKHYMFADTGTHSKQNYVIYMQDEWKINEKLSIVPGMRLDYHSVYKLHITPKISAMLKSGIFTIRGAYATGFRSPSLKELYSDYDMGGLGIFQIKGNPNLKPETSHQFSLSSEITKGNLNFSISAYHNQFKDKIGNQWQTDPHTGVDDYVFINSEDARNTGIEGIFKLKLNSAFTIRASYSFIDDYENTQGFNTSSTRPHNATFMLNYFKNIFNIETNTSLSGYWMSGIDTYTFDSEENSYSLRSFEPRYISTLQFAFKFPKGINLNLGINNLFNFKDKNISSTQTIMPEQGISFIASLSLNISDLLKL